MRKKILIYLFVLLATVGVFAQQEMKSGGGRFFVSRTGDIIVKARSDKSIALQSNTAVTGTLAVSSTAVVTGAATFSSTVGVTGNFAVNTNKFTVVASSGNTVIAGTLTVGSTGSAITRIAKYSATLSPAEVAANTCAEETFTVTGIASGDVVYVNKPTAQAGLGVAGVRAVGTNQVAINFCNATASPITPTASESYSVVAIR